MPPVRWKKQHILVCVLFFLQNQHAVSSKLDSVSMSEDGWKPIMGGGYRDPSHDAEITQYRNPAVKLAETVKAEKLVKTVKVDKATSHSPTTKPAAPNNLNGGVTTQNLTPEFPGGKLPAHSKPIIMMPGYPGHPNFPGHGPQIPISPAMMHRPPIKYGHIMKMHPQKRPFKPVLMQVPAYSTRDEIFVPAPSTNIGPYTFYAPAPPQVKTRLNHPHAHIEFNNHFPLPPNPQDDLFHLVRAPVQQYVIPKHPLQNDIHYYQTQDDYNRNLVPPPFKYIQEKEKQKIQKPYKVKDIEDGIPKQTNEVLISGTFQFPGPAAPPKQQTVEVQVTKEKLNHFHNSIPSNYNPVEEYEYHAVKTPAPPKHFTYEVTEGKHWQETPPYQFQYATRPPQKSRRPQIKQQHVVQVPLGQPEKPFLPTPLKPEIAPPTIPTDAEVSTIYNQVAQINRQKEQATAHPSYFDIKEVSTHFPIVGAPEQQEYPTKFSVETNEITTTKIFEAEELTTTLRPNRTVQRKRTNQRRRRPSTTTTEENEFVTDIYEAQKTDSSSEEQTERPVVRRRPSRFRTTTPPSVQEEITQRIRQRRPTISTTTEETRQAEIPNNHKLDFEPTVESEVIERRRLPPSRTTNPEKDEESEIRPQNRIPHDEEGKEEIPRRLPIRPTTEKEFPASFESHFSEKAQEIEEPSNRNEKPNRYYTNPPNREKTEEKNSEEDMYESLLEMLYRRDETTKESASASTPDNEVEYITKPFSYSIQPEVITTPEPTTTTTTSTTTTTLPPPTTIILTTTTEPSTTSKPHRMRGRPVKYDNSNRPRFSVKEYRQRISSSTTTEIPKISTETMRNRFPHRSRRPITTIGHEEPQDETTEPFRNKETNTTVDKPFKPVNPRLRPFGRYKPATEYTTATPRVSIKPNIFSNLRRPTPISLKNRILNKQQKSTTEESVNEEESNETGMSEIVESTIPYSVDSTTEFGAKKTVDIETTTKTGSDILKNEDFMQSQIVSDLTSSNKNEYNKPGLFKNVAPTSRKVPNYFTLATDDPILPIEAFFPNLKQ